MLSVGCVFVCLLPCALIASAAVACAGIGTYPRRSLKHRGSRRSSKRRSSARRRTCAYATAVGLRTVARTRACRTQRTRTQTGAAQGHRLAVRPMALSTRTCTCAAGAEALEARVRQVRSGEEEGRSPRARLGRTAHQWPGRALRPAASGLKAIAPDFSSCPWPLGLKSTKLAAPT